MNSSTIVCFLGFLLLVGFVFADSSSEEDVEGLCPGPLVCARCSPAHGSVHICVPPLANDVLIERYCQKEVKIHCIKPVSRNNKAATYGGGDWNTEGRCSPPLKCARCSPAHGAEHICVPPFANKEMINHYCEMKEKIHCITPLADNDFDSARDSVSEIVNMPTHDDQALALNRTMKATQCPFLFFCKDCGGGRTVCCPGDFTLQAFCCMGTNDNHCA